MRRIKLCVLKRSLKTGSTSRAGGLGTQQVGQVRFQVRFQLPRSALSLGSVRKSGRKEGRKGDNLVLKRGTNYEKQYLLLRKN